MSFDLGAITRTGGHFGPQRILIYGVQGLGKTTFVCSFEAPILLRTEDGAGALDVATFPTIAASYQDICDAIQALHGEHPFRTLVLDSLDWLEPLVLAKTCGDLGIEHIEDAAYGKGYVTADDNWRFIMGGLDSLRHNRGMTVVVIAHSEIRTHTPPDGEPYDRYQIRVHKRAFALWQEWSDMVLFCNYDRRIIGDQKKGEKRRAEGEGDRIIFTEERPYFLAKNRWGLPAKILIGQDKTWSAFHQALNIATHGAYAIPTTQEKSN